MVTEIRPGRWSMSDAANLMAVASKLARLAVGEETDCSGVNVPVTEVTADDMARAASEVQEWELFFNQGGRAAAMTRDTLSSFPLLDYK